MILKRRSLVVAILIGLMIMTSSLSFAQGNIDVSGIGFNIPGQGNVFLSFDNYFTAIVNGSGNPYYDYFFKPGTQSLKYDIFIIKDSLDRHVTFDSYFNSAISLSSGAKFGEVMNNVPAKDHLDEDLLGNFQEAITVDGELAFEPYIESSDPSVTATFTPDTLLNDGFALGKLTANVKGVTGATKYAVKYSVSNETETKYVTTSKVNNGQATTDLVQYKAGTTIIDILVYDSKDSQIHVFTNVTVK